MLQHHYVPNTALQLSSFNATPLRFQTGSFLYVGAQIENGQLRLNNATTVTEASIQVTNVSPKYKRIGSRTDKPLQGIIHIVDHFLDPSAQVFESDIPRASQAFIAGSCSNIALPYC